VALSKLRVGKPVKVTDESAAIRCVAGDGLIREEMWEDAKDNFVRYNLAFVNFHLFLGDNGRVLGYDTAHGFPHRHFAGTVDVIEPAPNREIHDRSIAEVDKLKRQRKL
jgi:hypothetical protein